MEIHPKAAESINKKANEFLSLIESRELGYVTSIAAGLVNIESKRMFSQEGVGIFHLDGDKWIGLNNDNVGKYGELIKKILANKEISSIVSFFSLKDICITWLFNSYLKKEERTLIQYLKDKISNGIGNYQIFCRVENLKINKNFNIGPVQFSSYSSEQLDVLLSFLNSEKHNDLIKFAKQRFENITVVTSLVEGVEIIKAREIVNMRCALAVNILKIFSPTLINTYTQCDFDLDFLLKGDSKSGQMAIKCSKEGEPLIASIHLNRKTHEILEIDEEYLDFMKERRMDLFNNFLNKPKKTELYQLIIKTINLLGMALSIDNLHLRIINLFTISEFLLLKGNDVPILDSLKKYFPILVSSDKKERHEIKKILTNLYSIRSAAIHHGEYKDFQHQDLIKFQEYLFSMIKMLISLSESYDTKDEVLKEIDESIASVHWLPRKWDSQL